MTNRGDVERGSVSIREFAGAGELGLSLEILNAGDMEKVIDSPRIQKLSLALTGFTKYLQAKRVQILGGTEVNYLKELDPSSRRTALDSLRAKPICCIVITRGLEAPVELIELASELQIPVLRTAALSSTSIARIGNYLEKRLAPKTTIHGVLVDIYGLGILILGPSGIGKSECGLELVLKGHRMVADDYVEIVRRESKRLVGTGGPILKHHMELRGLGIINIKELFGVSAIGTSQTIDLVIQLERWKRDAEYDRLGIDKSSIEILGVSIPLIDVPVAPGRNIAALVEVAARVHLLRKRGYQPSQELLADQPIQDASLKQD